MSNQPTHGREVRLAGRPTGWPTPTDFELATAEVPEPADGQVLVHNLWMSVDPYMRGRMDDRESYVPPYVLGAPLEGGAVGEVIASRSEAHSVGDVVLHGLGWREFAVLDGSAVRSVDADAAPPSTYLGILGMTGLTAYAGLVDVAALRTGETVYVSGAAGAVGSAAGQLARLLGASRVVGSAGSADKVRWLVDELGFDAAFDYKDGPVGDALAAVAPDGIDVYFDNVGGDHLEAAISALRPHGRAALCGSISGYNEESPPPGPRNLALLVGKRLTLQGFLVRDHQALLPDYLRQAAGWLREGRLRYRETVVHGLENAPAAFIDMLRGGNTGKALVKIR